MPNAPVPTRKRLLRRMPKLLRALVGRESRREFDRSKDTLGRFKKEIANRRKFS